MTGSSTPTAQRESVRNQVIDVAAHSFMTHGVKNVTMDDIAHTLGMSKRTLYQIFADKEELLLACICRHDEEACKALEELKNNTDNVFDFLLFTFARKMEDLQHVSMQFVLETMKYPKVQNYFRQVQAEREEDAVKFLQKGVEQGYFRPDVNFRIVYRSITDGIDLICRNKSLMEYTQLELFRNTALVTLRGCATLRGIELLDKFVDDYTRKNA